MPNGFHQTDKQVRKKLYLHNFCCIKGRPIFIVQFGAIRIGNLFDTCTADTIMHYIIKEIEQTWKQKFPECKAKCNSGSEPVDQITVIVDLKAVKLKDLSNKQVNVLFKALL